MKSFTIKLVYLIMAQAAPGMSDESDIGNRCGRRTLNGIARKLDVICAVRAGAGLAQVRCDLTSASRAFRNRRSGSVPARAAASW